MRIDRLKIFLDSMVGGAWPFLVGVVKCQLNCGNERDLDVLTRHGRLAKKHMVGGVGPSRLALKAVCGLSLGRLLRGTAGFQP